MANKQSVFNFQRNLNIPNKKKSVALYPHEYENFVLIVPNVMKDEIDFINYAIKSPLVNVWAVAILLVTLSRCFFRKILQLDKTTDWQQIFIDNVGLSFGWKSFIENYKNRSDKILILFLSTFSLIAGIFFSGHLLQKFAIVSVNPKISTFDDLIQSNLNIVIPREYIDAATILLLNDELSFFFFLIIF